MKKTKKWTKFRHRIVRNIVSIALKPYARIKYGARVKRFSEQGKRQYLILFNHQTAFDQFFVGIAFKGPVYYLATEDLFSNGWISSLIKYLVAPIPIRKQSSDVHAVINCIRVAREGGTIALAPEGNRTYSGETEYINPSVVMLAKKLLLPIALFRIEGGFGVHPRWSDKVRRGKMRGFVSEVIEPEEYLDLTNDELLLRIKDGLYVNESAPDSEYRSKRSAEYLERAIYVCPRCGLSVFHSVGELIKCKKCGITARYTAKKELFGVGCEFPFVSVLDWYRYQLDFMNSFNTEAYTQEPLYTDMVCFFEAESQKKRKVLRKTAELSLFGDKLIIDRGSDNEELFTFDNLTGVTVLGKNKLNIYIGKKTYQFKGDKRFCALKYVNIFHRHKNIIKGETNGKFLGL